MYFVKASTVKKIFFELQWIMFGPYSKNIFCRILVMFTLGKA